VRCQSSLDASTNVTLQSLLLSSSCRAVYTAPPTSVTSSMTSPRTCRSHIGRCDRRWADKAVAERCESGAPVSYVYAGLHAFRNRHCAHCNYVNDTYVTCDVTSAPSPPAHDHTQNTWRTVATVDLNLRRSVINYITRNQDHKHQQAVYDLPQCQSQHVFDPFSQQCRLVPSLQLLTGDTGGGVEYNGTAVNATSDNTYYPRRHHEYSLYAAAARKRSERLTALLLSIISVIGLVVVVVVYVLRPTLRAAVHGQTVLALVITLLLRQLLYVIVVPLVDVTGHRASVTCFCLSVALHYVTLTSACWLNALAVNSRTVGEKCRRSFACSCVYAVSAGLPVVIGMVLLSVMRLDGSDAGPACPWTLGLGQLMLHTTMMVIVLAINCVLYVVALCRHGWTVNGTTCCVSVLLTLVVMTDAALTVAAAVLPLSTGVVNLSLAMHATLGPLVCLSTLLPVYLHEHSCSLRRRSVRHQ